MANDTRTEDILELCSKGFTREEMADLFGLRSRQSVDQHMRRRGFVWSDDAVKYQLSPRHPDYKSPRRTSARALRVISELQNSEQSPESIAWSLGFDSVVDMGTFMLEHGYKWSATARNYIIGDEDDIQSSAEVNAEEKKVSGPPVQISGKSGPTPMPELSDFIPLLNMLNENQSRLYELIHGNQSSPGIFPRYRIPGNSSTKSIQMSSVLNEILVEFCKKSNLTQKEFVEAAIIDYLRRFGEEQRLQTMLGLR